MTAKNCGIGVRTLSRKMREYGLDKKSFKQKEPVVETPIMKPIDDKGRAEAGLFKEADDVVREPGGNTAAKDCEIDHYYG
jgi:hypothetical protein